MIQDFEPLARGDQDAYMGQMLFLSVPHGRLLMSGSYTHRPRIEHGSREGCQGVFTFHMGPKTAYQESFSPKLQPETKRTHFWRIFFPYNPQEPTK